VVVWVGIHPRTNLVLDAPWETADLQGQVRRWAFLATDLMSAYRKVKGGGMRVANERFGRGLLLTRCNTATVSWLFMGLLK
jgi:hypothetical protein